MVAIVQIYEANGGSDGSPGTKTRVDGQNLGDGTATDVRFCAADAYNDVAANPCIIPLSGDNYSYWKHLYLNISGTFTTVNNVNVYSDGTIGWACGTGGGLYVGVRDVGDNGAPMDLEYDVATGTAGTTGDWMDDVTNGHGYYKDETATPASMADYTSGSSLVIDSTDYSVADDSDAAVLQVRIHDEATIGVQSDEIIYFSYDEI